MYRKSDKALLEFVLQMIKEAETVVGRRGSAYEALNDFESKNSILLNLLQIGESLNRVKSNIIKDILPIKETYSVRNRITRDYGGIDLEIVEAIVNEELPQLRRKIENILK